MIKFQHRKLTAKKDTRTRVNYDEIENTRSRMNSQGSSTFEALRCIRSKFDSDVVLFEI